jgi:hypothetical protein
MAEHIMGTGHSMKFHNTYRPAKAKFVWTAQWRRRLKDHCTSTTLTETVNSCLAEPGGPCWNESGTHPMRIKTISSSLWTPPTIPDWLASTYEPELHYGYISKGAWGRSHSPFPWGWGRSQSPKRRRVWIIWRSSHPQRIPLNFAAAKISGHVSGETSQLSSSPMSLGD